MSSVDIIMQYGSPVAQSISDPSDAFLFFDDGTLAPDWTLDVLNYEENHDVGHQEGLDDMVYASPGHSVRLWGHASCLSQPL